MLDQNAANGNTGTAVFDLQLFTEGDGDNGTGNSSAGGVDGTSSNGDSVSSGGRDDTSVASETKSEATETKDTKTAVDWSTYTPTLPEGIVVDKDTMAAVTPVFTELGITKDQADKLVGLHASTVQAAAAKFTENLNTNCQKAYDEIMKDADAEAWGQINGMLKKYGDDKTPEQIQSALTVMAGFDRDAVKPLFNALAKMAKDASPDQTLLGTQRANGPDMYPGLPNTKRR